MGIEIQNEAMRGLNLPNAKPGPIWRSSRKNDGVMGEAKRRRLEARSL